MKYLQFLDMSRNFADWLKSARKKAGLTMEALADKVSVSKQYISVLERGEPHALTDKPVTPKRELVQSLAKALGGDENEALISAGYIPDSRLIIQPISDKLSPEDVEIMREKIEEYVKFLESQKENKK